MSNTPSASPLPRQIDPRKFAQQGIEISGSIELSDLSRLGELLFSSKGQVDAHLTFGIGEQRILNVAGRIDACVENICQRCLGGVSVELNCELNLAILWKEEDAQNLPKHFDPWIVGEGQTDIYQIVEDELLLSLPIVSYHDYECVPNTYFSAGEEEASRVIEQEPRVSPFQALEQLKGSLQLGSDSEETIKSSETNDSLKKEDDN